MSPIIPAARAAIRALPTYVPGARPDGRKVWKLSSNENPAPPSSIVLHAIADAASEVNRYPDMAVTDLTRAIAEFHSVVPEAIAVGNGSVAVIEDLLQAYCEPGDEVVYPWRSFEAYPICVQVAGATSVQVPLTADGRHDIEALAAAVTARTKVVLVCSPNNPTGTAISESEMRDLLDAVPRSVLVVLDEAYIEYVRQQDAVDGRLLVEDYPNLVTLRTFSKAYALCGLRVGYAIGNSAVIAPIRATGTPFGVNALAQRAARAALGQQEAVRASVAETVAERERVLAAARAAGWSVPPAEGNFFWLALGDESARFLADASEKGFLARGFAGDGVRISIGEKEANDLVIDLLQEWHPKDESQIRS